MRHSSILSFLAFFVQFALFLIVTLLIILIVRQWNEGLFYMPMKLVDESPCARENMQFIAFNQKKETSRGKNFSCGLKSYLDQWKLSDEFKYMFEPIDASKVVFVTYSSSNHFYEARKSIRSMRSVFKNKIIFYDLGLSKDEISELNDVCNLEVRTFAFDKYPNFVARLMGYNFKPIIMAEVFSEFANYWIVDTSVRFFHVSTFMNDFYANITSGVIESMTLRHPSSHSIFATTHPSMLGYLPMDTAFAKETEMLDANTMFISRSEMTREAVKWNVLCALTAECMAPQQSSVQCWFHGDRYGTRANCHRYDQSAINIITTSLLERDGWKRRDRVKDDSMRNFTTVHRGDGDGMRLSIPCQ